MTGRMDGDEGDDETLDDVLTDPAVWAEPRPELGDAVVRAVAEAKTSPPPNDS